MDKQSISSAKVSHSHSPQGTKGWGVSKFPVSFGPAPKLEVRRNFPLTKPPAPQYRGLVPNPPTRCSGGVLLVAGPARKQRGRLCRGAQRMLQKHCRQARAAGEALHGRQGDPLPGQCAGSGLGKRMRAVTLHVCPVVRVPDAQHPGVPGDDWTGVVCPALDCRVMRCTKRRTVTIILRPVPGCQWQVHATFQCEGVWMVPAPMSSVVGLHEIPRLSSQLMVRYMSRTSRFGQRLSGVRANAGMALELHCCQ